MRFVTTLMSLFLMLTTSIAVADPLPAPAGRPKFVTGEATQKSASSVTFDEGLINGRAKTAKGVTVDAGQPSRHYDFIKVRLRWVPEMLSTTENMQ